MKNLYTTEYNFEILKEDEMDQLKGGIGPKEKDVFDPDEK